MDTIHFGIIMTANLAIGMVTPPVGVNLYVGSGMSNIPILKLAKATIPFLLTFVISLLAITFIQGTMCIRDRISVGAFNTVEQGYDRACAIKRIARAGG